MTTYIELPDNFVDSGFGINAAFKVDVVAFFNAVRIQGGAQAQTNTRQIWKLESIQRSSFTEETPIFVSRWKYVKKHCAKSFFKTGSRVVLVEEEPKVRPSPPFFHKKKWKLWLRIHAINFEVLFLSMTISLLPFIDQIEHQPLCRLPIRPKNVLLYKVMIVLGCLLKILLLVKWG